MPADDAAPGGDPLDDLARGGLSAERITVAGRGETAPVATNDTEDGRQQNRRVVVGVTLP